MYNSVVIVLTDKLVEAIKAKGIEVNTCNRMDFVYNNEIYFFEERAANSVDEIAKWYAHSAIEVKHVVVHKALGSVYRDVRTDEQVVRIKYWAKPFGV